MAKRDKSKAVKPAQPTELSHNPFATLGGISAPSLPTQDAPPTPDPEPVANARFPKKLVVRMEKRGRRGKTVTRISGVPKEDLIALSKQIKKALGCGAIVEDNDLLLLGSLVDRAATWLESQGASRIVKGN